MKNNFLKTLIIIIIIAVLYSFLGNPATSTFASSQAKPFLQAQDIPYDDTNSSIAYAGSWSSQGLSGAYNNTEHFTNVVGSSASLQFSGQWVSILYRSYPLFGIMDIMIDDVKVATINQYSPGQQLQMEWNSNTLTEGEHTLTVRYASGGYYVTLDAMIVRGTPPLPTATPSPVDEGTYDDEHAKITYSGGWGSQAMGGAYNNSEHYTTSVGSSASLQFRGQGVSILYRGHPLFGNMDIMIDGVKAATINQFSSSQQLQRQWDSSTLAEGMHTLTVSYASSGYYVSLDAVIVRGTAPTPLPPLEGGTYDDMHPKITYSGSWSSQAMTGAYDNTEHYSTSVGSAASLQFRGQAISILYRSHPAFGNLDIMIDGVKVSTLNQYSSSQQVQRQWSFGTFSDAVHTLTVSYASGGSYVSLDAVIITGFPPTMTPTVTPTPTITMTAVAITPTLALATSTPPPTAQPTPVPTMVSYQGCHLPANNIWNARVDNLPVDSSSGTYINAMAAEGSLIARFGAGIVDGQPLGIPYNVVDSNYPKSPVSFDIIQESDAGPYPIPANAIIEGGSAEKGDHHIIVLDNTSCISYEIYRAARLTNGKWTAFSGAIFNMNSNNLRSDGWVSADGAGLPILPGLIRYDEAAAGQINHALRFTVLRGRNSYVWPARRSNSTNTDGSLPPFGQRFRLRSSFDVSGYAPEAQVILNALKTYGMILAGEGDAFAISGTPDGRWNNANLAQLRQIHASDFEAVDVSSIKVSNDSGEVR